MSARLVKNQNFGFFNIDIKTPISTKCRKFVLKPQFTFLITLLSRFCYMAVKFGVILTRLPHGLEMEIFQ
jgi:hypothetical protein